MHLRDHTEEYLAGRIRDLWRKAEGEEYVTHSRFLSLSEQALAQQVLVEAGAPAPAQQVLVEEGASSAAKPALKAGGGRPYWFLYGGTADADRRILVCCPSWAGSPAEEAQGFVACLYVRPRNERFTDHPGHRDYLGALMNLGITRDQIGDIYPGDSGAWIFVMREMADMICAELTSVRHTAVVTREVPASECTAMQKTRDVSGTIASERLDCIAAMAFHLSREKAKELIEAECVFADGRIPSGPSYNPAPGERISVKGYGKFIYLGTGGKTRKGRLSAAIRMFL